MQAPSAVTAKFRARCASGAAMIGGFCIIVTAGHFYCTLLVLALTVAMFKEVVQIHTLAYRHSFVASQTADWRATWSFYCVGVFAGSTQVRGLAELHGAPATAACRVYTVYLVAVISFVLSLCKDRYHYQFSLLACGHTCLVGLVLPAFAHIHNLYRGMIWFLVPASLVICNDTAAMVCGSFFPGARTRLIAVSPGKTWEGFCGGALLTLSMGALLGTALASCPVLHSWLACPPDGLQLIPFSAAPTWCEEATQLFAPQNYALAGVSVELCPVQLHTMTLAAFASTVAPFGGFVASGFKRAYEIKDFGATIPG
uniref:phosphatidate cytidylyltransferase n=1 Tax=viral metagenome TaxID=1070528 RepID=A0A6C0KD81_9ZZZZ